MSLSKRIASIALIFTLLCLTSVLHAQNTTSPCSKLIEAFDQESLALKSSEDIQWMNFIAEKGFFVQKLEDKGQGFPDLLERNNQFVSYTTGSHEFMMSYDIQFGKNRLRYPCWN